MPTYRVIGPCEVAGVPPGGVVTNDALEKAGAIVAPLIGVHLEEQAEEPRATLRKSTPKEQATRDGG